MEWLFGERLRDDEERSGLHLALRVALVMPSLYAFGFLVLDDADFALLAGFGSFAALAIADFMGPARARLLAIAGLASAGCVLIAIGTALSTTLWPAFVAMLVIAFVLQFAMALGGQFALGNNAAMLSYVLCAMVPASPESIAPRIAGWLTAMVAAAVVGTFLWPRSERRDLYRRLAQALRPLSEAVRAVADGRPSGQALHDANAAILRVRDELRELRFRPIGPPEHQQALVGLVDALAQAWRFTCSLVAVDRVHASDRSLARASAAMLDQAEQAILACAAGRRAKARVTLEIDALMEARHRHRDLMRASIERALRMPVDARSIVARLAAAFPVRILSFVTLSMAIDAVVMAGRTVRVHDDFIVLESPRPLHRLRHAFDTLAPLLVPETTWFHNSLRAALALAAALVVAKGMAIGHGFWVVLATLGVLRSNVVTTGSSILNALAGTLVGFALAALALATLGRYPALMWASLPFVIFAAAYAQRAISYGVSQALFALLVVEMFNLAEPEGLMTGVIRLEAVAIGAVVAMVVSVVMWPKGAATALREAIAEHVRAGRRFVDVAFAGLVGRDAAADVARAEAMEARRRADEALAAYMGERGAKRVAPESWDTLARVPVLMRLASDAVVSFTSGGDRSVDLHAMLASVGESFEDLARRLAEPSAPADPALRAAIADLDMIAGSGERAGAVLDDVVRYLGEHRGEPHATSLAMAAVWAVGWLGYLAHVRMQAEPALEEVIAGAER